MKFSISQPWKFKEGDIPQTVAIHLLNFFEKDLVRLHFLGFREGKLADTKEKEEILSRIRGEYIWLGIYLAKNNLITLDDKKRVEDVPKKLTMVG